MALSEPVRRLENSWNTNSFPKHLESIELKNVRGWTGQKIEFKFPITAVVRENGMGKSTIIQAAASVYKSQTDNRGFFASDFFPDTPWEELKRVEINAVIKEGGSSHNISIRKHTARWRGNDVRKERYVRFLDLKRITPIYSKQGYLRLAKKNLHEESSRIFNPETLKRLSAIIGKPYTLAKQATTNFDSTRPVPVLKINGGEYSGFHQGAGESTITELLALDIPQYSLVLIDEIETSLHPSAQRRLIRDLATVSRLKHVQFIVTTHSPYILDELPSYARIQILNDGEEKRIVLGVSSEFALSHMDDELHPEMDIYVEDDVAKILLEEIIAAIDLPILKRVQIISFGSAQVGKSLGLMNIQGRFPRPTLIFLDGDQDQCDGCMLLPGTDAPERQIYNNLNSINWPDISANLSRSHSDAAQKAMTLPDHHIWNKTVADRIICGGNDLWRAICRSWVKHIFIPQQDNSIVEAIKNKLNL